MVILETVELFAAERLHDLRLTPPGLTRDGRQQIRSDDVVGIAQLNGGVFELRPQGDREVRRKRPGGRRPDDSERRLVVRKGERSRSLFSQPETDVDGRRGVIAVFDFSLRECSLTSRAPVNRFEPLVHGPRLEELPEGLRDGRLERVRHRQVGILPVTEDTETLEVLLLNVDELVGELSARAAELGGGHLLLLRAELLVDLMLDRQSVTVPTRNVRRVVTHHRARLDHDVLQRLVESLPDMNPAVCIGRSVVKNELRPALPLLPDAAVQVERIPLLEPLRLIELKVRFHRERCLRQIEGLFPVVLFSHEVFASSKSNRRN